MSHTATASCTHCALICCKTSGQSVSAYSTLVHSYPTLHRRNQDWALSLRELGLSKADPKCLGMSVTDVPDFINSGHCPLLKFALCYNDGLQNSQQDQPFNAFLEDGYKMNLVAPDHLLTWICKGVLTIVFIQLQSDEARDKFRIYLRSSLTQYVFQTQSSLYKIRSIRSYKG